MEPDEPASSDEIPADFDPVCRMEFLPNHPHHVPSIEVEGKVFHFCSDACRLKFKADPDRFIIGRVGPLHDLPAEKPV